MLVIVEKARAHCVHWASLNATENDSCTSPEDQTDLEYLTCITTLSEGAMMRALIGHAADFIRHNVLAQHPALRHDPEWIGGTGGFITVADRQA